MAFPKTTLSGAVGERSAGKPAPNKPEDVKKIQILLKKALGPAGPVFKDGICDAAMKAAIADFQRLWPGKPDSTVEPNGHTLQRLDRLTNPLVLKPIKMCHIETGGWVIGYGTCDGGPLPAAGKGYTLHLGFPFEMNSIEVTDRPAGDLLSYKNNLCTMLAILEKLNSWGGLVQCRLYLKLKGAVLDGCTSNIQTLNAPVRPHNGRMLPLDETNNGPKLTYQGDPDAKDFHGRMFTQVPGYDKCIFVYPATSKGGTFETNNEFRGFDCITYAGTACGASNLHMAESDDLAKSLGATPIDHKHVVVKDAKTGKEALDHTLDSKSPKAGKEYKGKEVSVQLEQADPACVKDFFATNPTGYFLMWQSGHIVVVADGNVHEFKASAPSGYRCSAVANWLEPYKTMKLTVRRLPNKPGRAV